MKKTFFALITLFAFSFSNAQDDRDVVRWHYSLGAIVNPDFNINKNLLASGVHRIADVSPLVSFGWSVVTNNIGIDVDFGVATTLYGKKNEGYNLVQVPINLTAHYIFLDKEKVALSAGLTGSYTFYDLNLYTEPDGTNIDMNDLNPAGNTGYIRMNNQSVYVGPSLAFTFLKHKRNPLKLVAGYDLAVTNSKWKSDYATLANPVKENGGRAYLQLKIPFGSIGTMWAGSDE